MFILNLVINFTIFIAISFSFGALCAIPLKTSKYLFLSALIPWTALLIFNITSEYYSPDRELIQGTWTFFQLTFGTVAAIAGLIGGIIIHKTRARPV